jgi:hypothetical protein
MLPIPPDPLRTHDSRPSVRGVAERRNFHRAIHPSRQNSRKEGFELWELKKDCELYNGAGFQLKRRRG